MGEIKTIGVLTSGGDAPGMNAAIRAVVRTGIYRGLKVMAIRKGYHGLINGDISEMTPRSVSEIIHRGGTILQTARSTEFNTEEGLKKAASMARIFGIDAIVVIGGDGSYRGARDLSKYGIGVIGIPGTIDNDINSTEYSIGFDTAMNTVLDALDKLRDTAFSHERCSVLEVMGRRAGHIALNTSIAGGAEAVVLPEKSFDFESSVVKPILEAKNRGKKHYIVILSEGVAENEEGKTIGAIELAERIEEVTGLGTRATVLGHIQRGGSPTVRDRVMASTMGAKAIDLLCENKVNRIVALKGNKVVDFDIDEALAMTKKIDENLIELSRILST